MTQLKKFALVCAGYALALIVSLVIVQIYIAATAGPDRQTYAAMFDFGDTLLFLAVFAFASIPATGAVLYFLRSYRPIWIAFCVIGILAAVTALAALVPLLAPKAVNHFGPWFQLSPLRALIAPGFFLAFLLAGLFSPIRWSRILLLLVALNEVALFALQLLHWRHPY